MGLRDDIERVKAQAAADARLSEAAAQVAAHEATIARQVDARVRGKLNDLAREALGVLEAAGVRPKRLTAAYDNRGWGGIKRETARGPKGWELDQCPPLSVEGQFVTFASYTVYRQPNFIRKGFFTPVDTTPPHAPDGKPVVASWRLTWTDEELPEFERRVGSEYEPDPHWLASDLVAQALVRLGI